MKPIECLYLQMELEGIGVHNESLITRLHPDTKDFPLVLLARTSDGQSVRYLDVTAPLAMRESLAHLDVDFQQIDPILRIIASCGIPVKTGHFRTYTFPGQVQDADRGAVSCLPKDDIRVINFGFNEFAEKVYGVEHAGQIISACVSTRQNSRSAEAWVYTHPDHRRQGLAQQVVLAWAADLLKEGHIPFYSHETGNSNSANLAGSLKLVHVFDEIGIERGF